MRATEIHNFLSNNAITNWGVIAKVDNLPTLYIVDELDNVLDGIGLEICEDIYENIKGNDLVLVGVTIINEASNLLLSTKSVRKDNLENIYFLTYPLHVHTLKTALTVNNLIDLNILDTTIINIIDNYYYSRA